MLQVNEIFKSLLGESTLAGCVAGIIRLSGCNLRCRFCDTTYAYNEFFPYDIDHIFNIISRYQTSVVLVTGGEPLLQEEVYPLMDRFIENKYTVLLETNGSVSIDRVRSQVIKVVDLKCPGSGEDERIYWPNLSKLLPQDEIKFVIGDKQDLEWATKIVEEYQLARISKVLFSPVFGQIELSVLADWIIDKGLPVRLNLQIHKLIWGEVRGK